MNPLIESENNH